MSVDNLRASRDKAVAVFTEFTRLYKINKSALFCFFEGEDSQYYGIRIETITRPEKDFYLSCHGKEGVLGIHRILSHKDYANARIAYFIDKDFDKSITAEGLSGIYETPSYSIENFYTSSQCFSKVLRSEFKLTELDENFSRCLDLYTKLQTEFHDAVELMNGWIACQRDHRSKLDLKDVSILKFVDIKLTGINGKYQLQDLYTKFPNLPVIVEPELNAKVAELQSDRQKNFRGKFEIEFLLTILQKLMNEANQGNYPYFTRKVKVALSLSKRTIISDLSQYADTPDCLYSYLQSL
jgi:hypothetical protein